MNAQIRESGAVCDSAFGGRPPAVVTLPGDHHHILAPIADAQVPHLDVPYARLIPAISAETSDPAWQYAAIIPSLALSHGPPAAHVHPVPTTISLLWHDSGLFVRFTCIDDDPYAPFVGRDQPHHKGDVCEVFIDAAGDAQRWIEVQVSPANQILDKCFTRLAKNSIPTLPRVVGDTGYDIASLRSATHVTEDGWMADLFVPADAMWPKMAHPALKTGTICANLLRYDWVKLADHSRRLIAMNWSPVAWGQPHLSPHAMGVLDLQP